MANLFLPRLICLACLFSYARSASISGRSGKPERGLSFNINEFSASETEGIAASEIDGIIYVGDTVASRNVVHLTNSSSLLYNKLNQSSGRIFYNETIQLSSIASFSTHFVFSMYSNKNDSQGDGIAFFLAPEAYAYNIPQFTYGGWFGLVGDRPDLFAVAFESLRNMVGTFNHNFSGLHYFKNISFSGLNNGKIWDARIDYNSDTANLNVYLGNRSYKFHKNCILSQRVNLSNCLSGNVSIGFSSAAVVSNETHNIFSWSFNSSLYSKNSSVGFNSSGNGSEMGPKEKDRKQLSTSTKIFLGVGSAIVASVAGALLGYFSFSRSKRDESVRGQILADRDLDKLLDHIPRRFKMDDLAAGTNNFSEDLKLGQGGFGVYKCNLDEANEIVAVKRISEGSKQGVKEFISEVSIVSRVRHRNLVQLLGWCHKRNQLLLVYEYMSNGSLDRYIFTRGREAAAEEEQPQVLQWTFRYKIAKEIASALLYLHEEWDECVVHRDVKSSNIMLDVNFSAKIGDFGFARMVTHERLAQTTQAAGTLEYLAPECVASGKTSPESDVYSFGAVALEISCGKRVIDVRLVEFDMRLVAWAWDLYGRGKLLECADVRLNGEFEKEEMERLMVVGLWCSHPGPVSRPKMREVVRLLKFEVAAPHDLPTAMPVPSYSRTSFTTGASLGSVGSHSPQTTLTPR